MKIRLTGAKGADTDAVQAALDAVNGKARSHTIDSWVYVTRAAADAEKRLADAGVPLKDRAGAVLRFRPAGPGKAYSRKGRHVVSTSIRASRTSSGWFLTAVDRVEIWADAPEVWRISIYPEQAEIIQSRALTGFIVAPAP